MKQTPPNTTQNPFRQPCSETDVVSTVTVVIESVDEIPTAACLLPQDRMVTQGKSAVHSGKPPSDCQLSCSSPRATSDGTSVVIGKHVTLEAPGVHTPGGQPGTARKATHLKSNANKQCLPSNEFEPN